MLHITKLFLAPCDTYDDQYHRPYEMQVSGRQLNELVHVSDGGRNLTHTNLSEVAGRMLRPDAIPGAMATIANGWNERRYRFMMEVVNGDPMSANQHTVDIYSGYTDYMGVNEGTGSVDPNLRLYFTNVTSLRKMVVPSPHGLVTHTAHLGTMQVLTGKNTAMFSSNGDLTTTGSTYTTQPQDVFSSLSTRMFSGAVDYDIRQSFGIGVKTNRRSNGVASKYMDSVLSAHVSALSDIDSNGGHEDYSLMLHTAKGLVKEPTLYAVTSTASLLSDETFVRDGYIPFGRLRSISPHLDNVTTVASSRGARLNYSNFGGRGSTDGWGGRDSETVIACILSQAVPSFMFDAGMTVLGMTFTNRTMDGTFQIGITEYPEPRTFSDGVEIRPIITALIQYLKVSVLSGLLVNRGQLADITMIVDVMGDTTITVSLDGQPSVPYTVPSFADSIFAPVITEQANRVDIMASHFEALASSLSEHTTSQHQYNTGHQGQQHIPQPPVYTGSDIIIDPGTHYSAPPTHSPTQPSFDTSYGSDSNSIFID